MQKCAAECRHRKAEKLIRTNLFLHIPPRSVTCIKCIQKRGEIYGEEKGHLFAKSSPNRDEEVKIRDGLEYWSVIAFATP